MFFFGTRSFEPSEIKFVKDKNIFYRTPLQLQTRQDWLSAFKEVRKSIGNKKFVVSFDFDGIDPKYFCDVLVPESNGLSVECARDFINEFIDAINFEFVEYAVTGDKQSENTVQELIGIVAKTFD